MAARTSDKTEEKAVSTTVKEGGLGGKKQIEMTAPYIVVAKVRGIADILFNRYDCDAVEVKSKAAKGSAAKKTTDLQTLVYRDDQGHLCIPGEYFRQALLAASKFRTDPRSARKSARDLYNAGVVVISELCSLGKVDWDKVDRRRVTVGAGKAAIARERPCVFKGWETELQIMVNIPEYIDPDTLHLVLSDAGRLVGVGDFRPVYGRFSVIGFTQQAAE
jgi:hypothetical protein